jgi:hypothetical protein
MADSATPCNRASYSIPLRAAVVTIVLAAATFAQKDGSGASVRWYAVLFARNNVECSRADTGRWLALNIGDTLFEGDGVRTGWQSSVHLLDDASNEIIVAQGTKLRLLRSEVRSGTPGAYDCLFFRIIDLARGAVFLWSKGGRTPQTFRILTPAGTVENKGTRFFVMYSDSMQSGEIAVTEGAVRLHTPDDGEDVEIPGGIIARDVRNGKPSGVPGRYDYDDMKRFMDYFMMEQREFRKFTNVYLEELKSFKESYNNEFEKFKKERSGREKK